MGDNRIDALIADLDKSDKPTIRKAVDALVGRAINEPQIVTTLNVLLNDSTVVNRWAVAYILASLPAPAQSTVLALSETLDHRDPDIRWAVALLLVRLAASDKNIAKLLVELTERGTPNQKRMAIYCLRDLGLEDQSHVKALLSCLRDWDPTVRVAAVTGLKTRADLAEADKHRLLELFLKDQDLRVRNAAAVTLAQLGNPSEEFRAALAEASESDNAQLKKAAASALALINKRSAPTGS